MQFIQEPKRPGEGCVLCTYEGQLPSRQSRVLCRLEHAYVVLNKYPYAAGHLMVVPRRHVADLCDLDEPEHDGLWRLVRAALDRLRRGTDAEGMNLGVNSGAAAGAGLREHLHVHLVPRWVGDTNFMPALADVRVLPEYLEATWDRLAPHFADLTEAPA